jgi:hypothetical protein
MNVRYADDVREYIFERRAVHHDSFYTLSMELGLTWEEISVMFLYEEGLRNGTLKTIKEGEPYVDSRKLMTLDDLQKRPKREKLNRLYGYSGF